MWKKKIILQIVACIVIAAIYGTVQHMEVPVLQEKCASVVAVMSKHYSVRDIADKGKIAVINVIKAPAVVTDHIISSQKKQEYGIPIDDIEKGETGSVHSVAGGRVIETGENEENGLYIIIAHEDKVSIYGNCDKLYAKEGEHVRKGQVIASFTDDGRRSFYYELKDSE